MPGPAAGLGRRLDVVVPAHDEQSLIGGCLRAVLCDANTIDLRIIVVANGCSDGTTQLVRAIAADLPARDGSRRPAEVVLVELPAAGKAAALNAGDRQRRGDASVLYLDADTVITPGTLPALVDALTETRAARLVAPRPVLVRPTDRLGRDFAAVWLALPAVSGQVVGAGCYAVNPAGRARWTEFPELTADDAYVRSRFTSAERRVVGSGGFLLVLPRWRELIAVASRWRRGNAELASLARHHRGPGRDGDRLTRTGSASPAAGAGRNLTTVATQPALWPRLPGFLLVNWAGRLRPRQRWARAAGLRAMAPDQPPSGRPCTVDVLVIRRPRVALDRCLASLRSDWARLCVTVVDADTATVNRVADRGEGNYLLLVDGDVELIPGALDQLLAVAIRFPTAGLYGGAPAARRPPSERAGPADRPGRARRYDVHPTRSLPTGLLLVERTWWHRLGGLDGHHRDPEGNLCRRARRSGAAPMRASSAAYRD
ncbi:glycosyltransferase family 2 protein [Micromonospora polyrhachis]|uniref:4,4'-diaponeurosporenoate glycosyltransferase n=1 Tax=Micromonospora polyrhachis TaxID=1282883 RepID=A0A7W7WSF9_9ACTN|nr:glycosyltransferase family 2 protein [Micromonospora polyrhachis]MBB4961607.1 GT2 family glycosyltransferase [Micromonospora polyrhachis]